MTDSPLPSTGSTNLSAAAPSEAPAAAAFDAPLTHPEPGSPESRRNYLVIGLLLVSAFVVILNETIMGIALPRLVVDLGITYELGQWLTTAFMLTMAVVIPITGWLLQRFNTRPIFLTAMTLFSIGTLVSASAPGFEILLTGRIIQASGTAIMMPLLMTTVMTLVPPQSRGKIMGNISIVISVAPAVGPIISGLILSVLDWRWLFLLVLPIAVGSLILGWAKISNVTTPGKVPLDYFSVVLSAFSFGGLLYGISSLGEAVKGGDALPATIALVVGAVSLTVFILRQRSLQRHDGALLDLRTYKSRNFTVSVIMMAISMMGMFGTIILLPIYLQNVLGLDPLGAGLVLLPGGLIMGLLGPVVGILFDKWGPTPLLVPGAFIIAASFWTFAMFDQNSPLLLVGAVYLVLSIGLALMFTPLFTAALGSVPPHLYSHGSAMIGTVQQVAGAAGTTLFILISTVQTNALTGQGIGSLLAEEGGIRTAFFWGAIIATIAIIPSFLVRRPADMVPGSAPVGH